MTLSARVHWLLLAVHGSHWTCSERALTKRGFQSIIMSISVRRVRKTRYQSTSWEHDDVPFARSICHRICAQGLDGAQVNRQKNECSNDLRRYRSSPNRCFFPVPVGYMPAFLRPSICVPSLVRASSFVLFISLPRWGAAGVRLHGRSGRSARKRNQAHAVLRPQCSGGCCALQTQRLNSAGEYDADRHRTVWVFMSHLPKQRLFCSYAIM